MLIRLLTIVDPTTQGAPHHRITVSPYHRITADHVSGELHADLRDDTTHILFTPQDFIARLATLVPDPEQT
jgi:hypothetical protein